MNIVTSYLQNKAYDSREAYKQNTKEILHKIKEAKDINDNDRRNNVRTLLIRLYDDLMKNIKATIKDSGAINDDPIEGILAIADTCIEEQKENRKGQDSNFKLENDLYHILNENADAGINSDDNYKAKVNAFYSLCTKHRRIKDFKKFKELLEKRNDKVDEDEIFQIMQAYYLIQETANDFAPKEALRYWNGMISEEYKRLPAFTQIYTETVVLYIETAKDEVPDKATLLQEADCLIRDAIKMREYAKFYSTRGRIYCCNDEFDKGIAEVRMAIEAEDSCREDYTSRINEYQTLISRFQRKKDEKELREEAKKIKTELEKSKTNYISILGFFSGIMTLIIGGINTVQRQCSINDSLQLLLGITGMIIISFGSLNLMLVRRDEKRINKYSDWTLIVIGACLFVILFLIRILHESFAMHN